MGNRLHVARKYVVEYSTYENFNWKSQEFHNFLQAADIEICGTDRCIDPCPWDFEISKGDWVAGIDRLRNINALSEGHQAEINEALNDLGTTLPDMIAIMEQYLQDADPNWEYLEFAFF